MRRERGTEMRLDKLNIFHFQQIAPFVNLSSILYSSFTLIHTLYFDGIFYLHGCNLETGKWI